MKQENDDSYSHILKYTSLFGGVQGLSILIAVVRNKLVAMILGPDGMGLVSLFNSTIKLLSDSTNFGLSMSGVKNVSEAYASGDEARLTHAVKLIRVWSLLAAIIGMVLCVALAPLLSRWTFSWGDHTLHFVLLSPVIALLAITGGESAILKGTRQLRHLAVISIYTMVAVLLCTVPLYYFFGQQGIVPSLVIAALAGALVTVAYSWRLFPLHIHFSRAILTEGRGMISLGVAFVLAGVLGSGAEFLIRSYLNNTGELVTVGLYNAGYMMTMTYAGMIFSSMETDYFPRLSGQVALGEKFNQTVNHQMEVSLLLVAPLLVIFLIGLPVLLPLLYSGKFLPVLGMMRFTVLAMYFRALSLPLEYIALARGDSMLYLILEAFYDVLVVAAVVLGFRLASLTGTGVGLLSVAVVNVLMVLVLVSWRYGYRPSASILRYLLAQLPLGLGAFLVSWFVSGWLYWVLGLILATVSTALTLCIFHSKARLWSKLTERWRRHLKL